MMGNTDTTPTSKDVYYLKIRTKGEHKPHFQVKFHAGEKEYEDKPNVTFVEGYIKSIEPGEYEWEGDTIKTFTIVMVDKNDMYIVETSYTMISRSILNMLSSTEYPGRIKLALYYSQSGYPSAYAENNGEQLNWNYPMGDMKKYIKSFDGPKGKKFNDYTALDEFFEGEINALSAHFGQAYESFSEEEIGTEEPVEQEEVVEPVAETPAAPPMPKKGRPKKVVEQVEDVDDNLPF